MVIGIQLALEAIAHDLSLAAEDPESAEIESLLVQTHQMWETIQDDIQRAGLWSPSRIESLFTAARQSLSNGDSAFALEDVRDAVDVLRRMVSLLHGTDSRHME